MAEPVPGPCPPPAMHPFPFPPFPLPLSKPPPPLSSADQPVHQFPRGRGDCWAGHLRYHAVHPLPRGHAGGGAGRLHGLPAAGGGRGGAAALAAAQVRGAPPGRALRLLGREARCWPQPQGQGTRPPTPEQPASSHEHLMLPATPLPPLVISPRGPPPHPLPTHLAPTHLAASTLPGHLCPSLPRRTPLQPRHGAPALWRRPGPGHRHCHRRQGDPQDAGAAQRPVREAHGADRAARG